MSFGIKGNTFFEEEIEVNRQEYYDKTIKELIKIEDVSNYDEIVLWFEYDLVLSSQFNGSCALIC